MKTILTLPLVFAFSSPLLSLAAPVRPDGKNCTSIIQEILNLRRPSAEPRFVRCAFNAQFREPNAGEARVHAGYYLGDYLCTDAAGVVFHVRMAAQGLYCDNTNGLPPRLVFANPRR